MEINIKTKYMVFEFYLIGKENQTFFFIRQKRIIQLTGFFAENKYAFINVHDGLEPLNLNYNSYH